MKVGGDPKRFVEVADGVNRAECLDYDPELVGILRRLSLSVEVDVFTGASRKRAEEALSVLLGEDTSLVSKLLATGDLDGGIKKPSEEAFRLMLIRFGIVETKGVVMADDWPTDLLIAKSLGAGTILVGENHNEGDKSKADAWIPNIYGLMGLFE